MRTVPWTPDELAFIEAQRQEWLAVGLSTAAADWEAAEAAITAIYKTQKRNGPTFFRVSSPSEAFEVIHRESGKAGPVQFVPTSCWGAQDAYWVGWHRTAEQLAKRSGMKPIYSAKDSAALALWEAVTRSCFWWWPFERAVVLCDRPLTIMVENFGGVAAAERWRWHSETGPALTFRDGRSSLWAIHGVVVTQQIVEAPHTLTPLQISQEPNAEIRAIMLQRYGIERYFAGMEAVQQDDFGKLYKTTFADNLELAIVRVVNGTPEADGSFKEYAIPVPADCSSAHEAVARTYGLTVKQYWPERRT